jgi:rfaE bifunctional protein kinase chain/domain
VGIVGDLVADVYISGLTDRVSREAPVLIVRHEKEWLRPGGAANVAANVAALGATACLVGTVGDDEIGQRLLAQLRGASFGSVRCDRIIPAAGRSTISKTRFMAGAKLTQRQQVLRLDRQPAEPPDEALIARIREQVAAADGEVDAWVASDYGYGSFDNALRDQLRQIARRKPVLADSRWELARFAGLTILKPNEEEARATAQSLGFCAMDDESLASELAAKLEARAVVMTLGNKGLVLCSQGRVVRIPAVGTDEIVDLTGAGDSVAAALATALAAGCDDETAARLANHAGGIVVMKEGAATASPEELQKSIEDDSRSVRARSASEGAS